MQNISHDLHLPALPYLDSLNQGCSNKARAFASNVSHAVLVSVATLMPYSSPKGSTEVVIQNQKDSTEHCTQRRSRLEGLRGVFSID